MNGIILVTDKGHLLGNADYTRYNKLSKFKKFLCFFSKRYKNRFIDLVSIEIKNTENNIDIILDCEKIEIHKIN